ncbi:hypothetical protein I7I50_10878 [Histoplasma capsulatum G186AR]|uniref:Uncharacterized protein n=1 Tax=Ajellomyces capsulatus TaxID=5037 RepID=A0A8H7Z4E2_AJECA|nr:hypothetical protein I7I52_02117 [Histoplasma capsulatum]QSS69552.1 hypothetical protein I7I50_10878 [Histoplasma capsulatum G186AR]
MLGNLCDEHSGSMRCQGQTCARKSEPLATVTRSSTTPVLVSGLCTLGFVFLPVLFPGSVTL